MKIDIGIPEKGRKEIAEGLSHLLADTYMLYYKTHYYHWNVTGPMFNSLHLMFETQYNELWQAIDVIAERIRSLGFPAGGYKANGRLTKIEEDGDDVPSAEEMLKNLVKGHETVTRTARSIFDAADAAHDEPTADLLTQRMEASEKTAWMLRSTLG